MAVTILTPATQLATGAVAVGRRRLATSVRQLVAGDAPMIRDLSKPVTGDPGLFGPDSVTWRIHADACMFVAGVRALLLQTMHPLAMAGVADHSGYREDPLGRLSRTAHYVGVVSYGTTDQATDVISMVKHVHEHVVGTAPNGRHYEANDPHLLLWVHHALTDSFLRTYQRYGAEPLTEADADRYVAEQAVLADLFGAESATTSVAELEAWFRAEAPQLWAGPQARTAARWLLAPPLPLAARPPYVIVVAAAIGLLPPWVRGQLRLPLAYGIDPLLVRPATRSALSALSWIMGGYPVERASTFAEAPDAA